MCCVTPGRRLEREPRLLFHPSNPRRPHQTATGRRDGDGDASHDAMQAAEGRGDSASTDDADRDREVFRLQWRFSAREEERTGSVFSNPSHTPLPWPSHTPGPRPQLFHVTGKFKKEEEKGRDRRVYCAGNWGKGRGKVYIFCLFVYFS